MSTVIHIATLLFVGLVLVVSAVSIAAFAILFKHAERKSVATSIALVYVALFLFLLLGSFTAVGVL